MGCIVLDPHEENADTKEPTRTTEIFEVPALRQELSECARIERTHPVSALKQKGHD
jgi:hypothetical protein